MKKIDLAYLTLFADLNQRVLDASFETPFPLSGNFVNVPVNHRDYWYFNDPKTTPVRRYVGAADDPEVALRVLEFRRVKDTLKARRAIVSSLRREAALPAPELMTGDLLETLERAGLFRSGAVVVGTVAYQAYSIYLGVKLPGAAMEAGNLKFGQTERSAEVGADVLPPVLDVLRGIDPTFRPMSQQVADDEKSTWFINAGHYRIGFLTPNSGVGDDTGKPAIMPTLGGAAAQPMRFLEFLIYEPVRTTLLHRSGVPVLVPSPGRYAVHKLIVAANRKTDAGGQAKRAKDLMQATSLAEAMDLTRRSDDLAEAFIEAWTRGPRWRESILSGLNMLADKDRQKAIETIKAGILQIGESIPEEL